MNNSQLDLLLNSLYNCALSIEKSILAEDRQELDLLISKKKEVFKVLSSDKSLMRELATSEAQARLKEIQSIDDENIRKLKERRDEVYSEYLKQTRNSKLISTYSINADRSGLIVDIKE